MTEFKVGDLVRVKPKKDIPREDRLQVGPIDEITGDTIYRYRVNIKGRKRHFTEDELEKI